MKKILTMFLTIMITCTLLSCSSEEKNVGQANANKTKQEQQNSNKNEFKDDEVIGYMQMGDYWDSYINGFRKMGINFEKENSILFTDLLKKGGFTFISDSCTKDEQSLSKYQKENSGNTSISAIYSIFAKGPNNEEVQFRFLFVSKLQFDNNHNQLVTYEVQMLSPILNNGNMTRELYKSWKVFDVIPTTSYSQKSLDESNKRIEELKKEKEQQEQQIKKYQESQEK